MINPKTKEEKLELNTVLYTKDGTRIGNAIVVDIIKYNLNYFNNNLPFTVYIIKTDYGNSISLIEEQIREYFYIGKIAKKFHKHYADLKKEINKK